MYHLKSLESSLAISSENHLVVNFLPTNVREGCQVAAEIRFVTVSGRVTRSALATEAPLLRPGFQLRRRQPRREQNTDGRPGPRTPRGFPRVLLLPTFLRAPFIFISLSQKSVRCWLASTAG